MLQDKKETYEVTYDNTTQEMKTMLPAEERERPIRVEL